MSARRKSSSSSSTSGQDQDKKTRVVRATNRKARHTYVISDKIEAGIVLTGSEVKSLRVNTPTLNEGYARVEDDELWLYGVYIPPLAQASFFGHEPVRKRKLLIKRREIRKLKAQLDAKGMTAVPLALYFLGPKVKVEIGLGKGRDKGDKRQYDREKTDRKRMREAMNQARNARS